MRKRLISISVPAAMLVSCGGASSTAVDICVEAIEVVEGFQIDRSDYRISKADSHLGLGVVFDKLESPEITYGCFTSEGKISNLGKSGVNLMKQLPDHMKAH